MSDVMLFNMSWTEVKTEISGAVAVADAVDEAAVSGVREGNAASSGDSVCPPAGSGDRVLPVAGTFVVLQDLRDFLDPRREGGLIARRVPQNAGCSSGRSQGLDLAKSSA